MNAIEGILYGFSVALAWGNLLACFIGVLIGTIVGVLPGIGPVGAMALLLPVTYTLTPAGALIMLAGIYYGSMYGGSTTSILVNIPGEVASMITTLDGYQMARRGRAGAALFVAAIGSFVAGTLGVVGLAFVGPLLSKAALTFGPPEFFTLCLLGLMILSRLTGSSLSQSFVMVAAGLALSTIGMEPMSGTSRFTFGFLDLSQGVDLVPIAMGMFGMAEILTMAEEALNKGAPISVRLRELLPTKEEWRRSRLPIVRGSLMGFLFGLVPGPTALIATFTSYAFERKLSKHPEQFGKGAIEGVAGPEAANNGAAQGAFIPLLTLGIPFAPASAMLLTALLIHGEQPRRVLGCGVEHVRGQPHAARPEPAPDRRIRLPASSSDLPHREHSRIAVPRGNVRPFQQHDGHLGTAHQRGSRLPAAQAPLRAGNSGTGTGTWTDP
jgi:putative tricarboxylic transport membrane protein